MMLSFGGKMPRDEGAVFVAANATVLGDVTLGRGVNIWYGAVLRADEGALILGENSNVQDNAVLHCDVGGAVTLGRSVTVGHSAVVHGCTVGDGTLIGMHLKRVAVPVRLSLSKIGEANILCARTRPKLIGGERAKYTEED